jgi:hypothetical protein
MSAVRKDTVAETGLLPSNFQSRNPARPLPSKRILPCSTVTVGKHGAGSIESESGSDTVQLLAVQFQFLGIGFAGDFRIIQRIL